MINIAICDNDITYSEVVKDQMHHFFMTKDKDFSIDHFIFGKDLLASNKIFNLCIFEVIIPDIDGIALAKEIRKKDLQCIIIFLTTSKEHALQAYEVDALQYLLKPLELERFTRTMERATSLFCQSCELKKISIPTPNGMTALDLHNLEYVEHIDRVLHFHMVNGLVIFSSNSSITLTETSAQLSSFPNFISPHRAFIVNMDCIAVFHKSKFLMNLGNTIPISQKIYHKIKQQYLSYLLSRENRQTSAAPTKSTSS